jgi:diaminohydroxyphosphoribosylaminopyrimidine deaminase / 5-amino-6-(5-phosphoribosylamino)uracil reductase
MTPAEALRDGAFMRRALQLARRGWGQTAPNPMVGAVVVRDGRIIAEGWHARFGEAHAEAMALAAAGDQARGADVYVTLEPCAHHGKTPPCADALVAAGVRRVVIACSDPNVVAGGGAARLLQAGIDVVVGVGEEEALELNAPFLFAHRRTERPFVTLKLALSLDGAIAPADRRQTWLTGDSARRQVHRLRAEADAILVGLGTARADDPDLTVRHGRRPRVVPRRVVVDRRAELSPSSRLAVTARKVPVEVLTDALERSTPAATPPAATAAAPEAVSTADFAARIASLEALGVSVHQAPGLKEHLAGLRQRGVRHLFAEGGASVAGALLNADSVDRLIIFRAPVLLGAGALAAFGTVDPIAEGAGRWHVVERRRFGDDLMTVYRPVPR